MRIRIDDIKEEGLTLDVTEAADDFPALAELAAAGECRFFEPIRVALRALLVDEMVEVEGRFDTRVRFNCSRCLREFDAPLAGGFALTFVRKLPEVTDEASGEEIEVSAGELGLTLFSGDEIDLVEAIQEQVIMALPMRPLCRETCRGLCPQCGADRNERECGCERPAFGAKFSALKDFKVEK